MLSRASIQQLVELSSRCLLLAAMDTILAQRLGLPKLFTNPYNTGYYSSMIVITIWWIINVIVFVAAVVLLFQRLKQLIDSLCFVLSAVILYVSFTINESFVHDYLHPPGESWRNYYANLVCGFQFALATVYLLIRTRAQYQTYGIFCSKIFRQYLSGLLHLIFCLPAMSHFIGISPALLKWLPFVCAFITHLEIVTTLAIQLPCIAANIERNIISFRLLLRHHGLQLVIESQWVRLRVPTVLQTFWICKLLFEVIVIVLQEQVVLDHVEQRSASLYDMDVTPEYVHMYYQGEGIELGDDIPLSETWMSWEVVLNMTVSVMLKGCDGVIPLLGMTTMVSRLTHYLGIFLAILVDSHNDDDRTMGTMCGILFFVLALQTGLTRLEPEKRLVRLYRNTCLLFTAILHFVHSMVHPILMSISSTRTASYWKHARVLSMCLFLVLFPSCLLSYLWLRNTVSPWLLAVTAFSIEVIIKVSISVMIYSLFLLDSLQEVFWEKLDDYIYYIKATGNTIEFLFGIFLFCNGAWIMLFESGGMIRAFMMCVHAYFNIWIQACEGWRVFIQRRSAVAKINSLPVATPQDLLRNNDVCSICHDVLETARVTRCHHLFHSVCLRKWLYHQDRCPMCHKSIYKSEPTSLTQNDADQLGRQVPHLHQD